jgi:hypothetical protein
VAAEFMLYATVFMFVVVAAFIVISQLQSSEIPLRQNSVARETGQAFADIITLSVKGGEGFSYAYTFPKTIFGMPYAIDMTRLADRHIIFIDWAGPYGNFTYQYAVPAYGYALAGSCLDDGRLESDMCANMLILNNVGNTLTITQGA